MLVVIPACGPVLLGMMKSYGVYLTTALDNKDKHGEALALELIGLILHIFYSLNCVEFPAFFEDTLNDWMGYFKFIMELRSESEGLRKCKTRVVKNVTLYCEKYSSDFKAYIRPFFELIWNLIELTTMDTEYDKVKT